MKKVLETLKISAMLIGGGLAIPALLSILFSGFRVNQVSIVSFQFFVGIIMAIIGGILVVYDFSQFKKRVMKTPIDMELEKEEAPEKPDLRYILLCSGFIIVLAAIALGEI